MVVAHGATQDNRDGGYMIVDTIIHEQRPWHVLGQFFCDRTVHRDVGGPLFSGPGSVWFVHRAIDSSVLGFCSLSDRGATTWYDCAYVVPERRGNGVFRRLAHERDVFAARLGKPIKTAVRAERLHHYTAQGFVVDYERDGWVYCSRGAS